MTFPRFRDIRCGDFKPRNASQKDAFEKVSFYCGDLSAFLDAGKGFTFVGPPGTGKTLLASIVLNEAHGAGYSVDAMEMATFINLFHTKFDLSPLVPKIGLEEPQIVVRYMNIDERLRNTRRKTDFVLFDDVGKEYDSGSGWSNGMWDWYLRYRYNRLKPTIITTNTPIGDWAQRYSESMESFLLESTTVITLTGEDHRKAS